MNICRLFHSPTSPGKESPEKPHKENAPTSLGGCITKRLLGFRFVNRAFVLSIALSFYFGCIRLGISTKSLSQILYLTNGPLCDNILLIDSTPAVNNTSIGVKKTMCHVLLCI